MLVVIRRARAKVIALLFSLFALTYLDRVCISVAGPRMQDDLHIDPVRWGWVTGAFAIAYCLFEIPTGALGDRIGPRRILTRIVVWWSAFTMLTGVVSRYPLLLLTRFLFGAGEAGAFPNAGVVVGKWFPPSQRATMSGMYLMASQVGGALAPLIIVPIQMRWGWRASFIVLGFLGLVWASVWFAWFRDSPAQKLGVTDLPENLPRLQADHQFPWRAALHTRTFWMLLALGFSYIYAYNFFQTWFHTYLVKGRGTPEALLWLSALPYVTGALGNITGGAVSDALVVKWGRKDGRRFLGIGALVVAASFVLAAAMARQQVLTIAFLSVVYGAITVQQSAAFGVCLDISPHSAGAMIGAFNTACQLGGFAGSVAFGYIVNWTHSYDAPFYPMATLLLLGAYFWWRLDASQELSARS